MSEDIEGKEEIREKQRRIEAFFSRHEGKLDLRMPPMDFADYLIAFERGASRHSEHLNYFKHKSPYLYTEKVLDFYADKILFNSPPSHEIPGAMIAFAVQDDPSLPRHLRLTVYLRDLSFLKKGGFPLCDFVVSAEVYCRSGKGFTGALSDMAGFIADIPDDENEMGFRSGGGSEFWTEEPHDLEDYLIAASK